MNDSLLRVDKLTVGYGELPIVHDVSLVMGSGEIVGIIGPNGSGKSTLLRGLLGLNTHFTGSVAFMDAVGSHIDHAQIAVDGGICYVPQHKTVFPDLSVRDHLFLGAIRLDGDIRAERVSWASDYLGALSRRQGDLAGNLSGGQQRLLGLVRALVSRPALILLDEPSIGLDQEHRERLYGTIADLCHDTGISFLIVEQHVRTLFDVADRFLLLRSGRLALEDIVASYRDRLEDLSEYFI